MENASNQNKWKRLAFIPIQSNSILMRSIFKAANKKEHPTKSIETATWFIFFFTFVRRARCTHETHRHLLRDWVCVRFLRLLCFGECTFLRWIHIALKPLASWDFAIANVLSWWCIFLLSPFFYSHLGVGNSKYGIHRVLYSVQSLYTLLLLLFNWSYCCCSEYESFSRCTLLQLAQ